VLIDRLRRVDRALSPRTVRLEAAPHAEQALSAYFAAPIHFGSARAELVFATADLRRPSPRANPYLAAVLDRHANDLLARLPATSSYADHVRRVIARVIERGSPSLEAVAHELHASPRTVQRRLAELGTSHKALVEEVRRSLAEQHLESERSLTAVAFSLGYRAESSFRRAYRKWTGRRARARRA
jgi:AraC-like DNA-binding protein